MNESTWLKDAQTRSSSIYWLALQRRLFERQSSEPSINRTTAGKKEITMYYPITGYYTEISLNRNIYAVQ